MGSPSDVAPEESDPLALTSLHDPRLLSLPWRSAMFKGRKLGNPGHNSMVGMVQICSNIDWLTVIDIIDHNDYRLVNRHRGGNSWSRCIQNNVPYLGKDVGPFWGWLPSIIATRWPASSL